MEPYVCEWTQYEEKGEPSRLNIVLLLCCIYKSSEDDRNTLFLFKSFIIVFHNLTSHHKLFQSTNTGVTHNYYLIASNN